MKLKIAIDLENAAFEGFQGFECARILRRLAEQIDGEGWSVRQHIADLIDVNGNNVGEAKVTR